ncbi:MAG: lysophospholipid acyltransferase family protein [Gammaproteobacteria bacterium]
MNTLIAFFRALAFVVWTVLVSSVIFLLQFIFGADRPSWQPRRQWLFRCWARGGLRVLNVDLTIKGEPPVAPYLLISNHLGYLDIVVFAATVDATFVAKQEVAHWPFLGAVVRVLGTIFVDRTKRRDVARVNGLIEQSLGRDRAVIVFAEGTSSDGTQVLPLRPSLLSPAAGGRYPVHYARLAYSTGPGSPDAGKAVCWWGDAEFLPHAWGLFRIRRINALIHFGAETVTSDNRKDLAVTLHERIRSLPMSLT